MTRIKAKIENIKLMDILFVLFIILIAIPREFTVWSFFSSGYNRPFGNGIGISIPLILLILMCFVNLNYLSISGKQKSIVIGFFIFAMASLIFPIRERIWELSFIGSISCILYLSIYLILSKHITYPRFEKCLDIGFSIALIFQSIIGMLYVFGNVSIPYISYGSVVIRNGLSRMTGTFTHPGDFSLYISIIYIYFLCKYFFKRDKKTIIFILLSLADLLLSGARTMLVASVIITVIVLWRKYRHNVWYKMLVVIISGVGIFKFFRSNIFQDLFIENNIVDMLTARFIHWKIGVEIIFMNISNFLFGVGLNNHVDYIDANYSSIEHLITNFSVLEEGFVRGMPIHNSFLAIGVELGIIGLILYIMIFISAIRKATLIMKLYPEFKSSCYFIIISMFSFVLYGVQGWALLKDFGWILIIIVCAFLKSIERTALNETSIKKMTE